MGKKILGAVGIGKKKKADPTDATKNMPDPVVSALSPEEVKRRKLLRGRNPLGASSTILGGAGPSNTLGG